MNIVQNHTYVTKEFLQKLYMFSIYSCIYYVVCQKSLKHWNMQMHKKLYGHKVQADPSVCNFKS